MPVGRTSARPSPPSIPRSAPRRCRRSSGRGAASSAGDAVARPHPGPELLAEVLVLAALNEDPAATGVRELVDDQPLRDRTPYEAVLEATEQQLGGRSATAPSPRGRAADAGAKPAEATGRRAGTRRAAAGTAARADAPARRARSTRSSAGSASTGRSIIRGDAALARRIDLALDVLAEEARALELKGAGDHFGGPIVVETPDYRGLDSDAVGFSQDTEWMPRVVLMAKSTYVWLEQLAARHGRAVPTLADVPDEELDRLAELGVTGLWLIGLWQRSRASAEIKRRRGDADAVASAYAIDEYRIADDLGGEAAFEDLKRRAWDRGIRIAADMVPNHMGIDSRWVIEHPERFISLPDPPFPAYSFTGPEPVAGRRGSTSRSRTTTGTARTRRWSSGGGTRQSNEERFIYHGNDGTSYPWNDTAQLDYLNPEVREAVIRTILDVARRAPILRFDAAMVLARRHIRRLWYPGARRRRRDPVPRRARALDRGVQPADAEGVLARGRRPGGGRGARDAAPGRGVLAARGLLRADPRACTASTTRRSCTCSATRTTRATERSCATRSSSTRASSAGS